MPQSKVLLISRLKNIVKSDKIFFKTIALQLKSRTKDTFSLNSLKGIVTKKVTL